MPVGDGREHHGKTFNNATLSSFGTITIQHLLKIFYP